MEYSTRQKILDIIENAPAAKLSALLTPFFIELGPLAPLIASAIAYGSRALLTWIVKMIPYKAPRGSHPNLRPKEDDAAALENHLRVTEPLAKGIMDVARKGLDEYSRKLMEEQRAHQLNGTKPGGDSGAPNGTEPFANLEPAYAVSTGFEPHEIEQPEVYSIIYPASFIRRQNHPLQNPILHGPNVFTGQVGF